MMDLMFSGVSKQLSLARMTKKSCKFNDETRTSGRQGPEHTGTSRNFSVKIPGSQ